MSDTERVWPCVNLMASKALERFGKQTRVLKLLEEMGELQSELAKSLIGHKRASDERVIDEIADVFITLESVAIAFGFERVEAAIPGKLDRLGAAIAETLPPVPPPAAERAHPPAQPSQTEAVEGRGAYRSWELMMQLERAIGAWNESKITDADLGIELLRISNELATESKRLRAPVSASGALEAWAAANIDPVAVEEVARAEVREDPNACFTPLPGGGECALDFTHDGPHSAEVTPSGGAEALPSGWYRIGDTRYAYGSAFWDTGAPRVDRYGSDPGYRAFAAGALTCVSPWPPTLAQAMCAALGIRLSDVVGVCQATLPGGATMNRWVGDGREDKCAHEALEAFHARQQPAPAAALRQEADEIRQAARELTAPMHRADECKCWHAPPSIGTRRPNRYCRVPEHASEWQTLAEQRSELHEDGTPRAGCEVCSAPELDASERGLR